MFSSLLWLENFYYKTVLKNLIKTSQLGYGLVVSGADSGVNFERIYDNKPKGAYLIGRFIDKVLLNLPSAQATRVRKDEIRKFLWNEIQNNQLRDRKTKILDLASGTARYIRELREEHSKGAVESVCVDRELSCVRLGRLLCQKEGVENLRFIKSDIFRLQRLVKLGIDLNWKANVVIASGLLMYFDNGKAEAVLKEIYNYLPDEALLIFSSLERVEIKKLMRKTMSISSGGRWILYHRKPDYWRGVLHKLGFGQILIIRDKWHLQDICVARKLNASNERR